MTWHLEPVQLVARGFETGKSFDGGDDYSAVISINLMGPGLAWAFAANSRDGVDLKLRDFKALAQQLHREYGITQLMARRGGKVVTYDLTRYAGNKEGSQ
jgi:hypothetical protein